MDYFSKRLFIPRVDESDKEIEPVERWSAHEKGILHRGFTICLMYKSSPILQHRKHPAFDGYFDLTCSSHPTVDDGKTQNLEEAVKFTLEREWYLKQNMYSKPLNKGKFTYEARDPKSNLVEHEVCHFFTTSISSLPTFNLEFAYGFSVVNVDVIKNPQWKGQALLTPWAKKIVGLDFI